MTSVSLKFKNVHRLSQVVLEWDSLLVTFCGDLKRPPLQTQVETVQRSLAFA